MLGEHSLKLDRNSASVTMSVIPLTSLHLNKGTAFICPTGVKDSIKWSITGSVSQTERVEMND